MEKKHMFELKRAKTVTQTNFHTVVGPNNELLNNELFSLFSLFSKNKQITNLRKVRYLSRNLLKARYEKNLDLVQFSQNNSESTKI